MALPAGAQLGVYEIVALVGAGGMGEVYRARDTRLDRTVAIKVLPSQFAADPQLRDRFDREARAISSLNHPHICALYDVGEAAIAPSPESPAAAGHTIRFLVLEYLDGDTVAARLARAGPFVPAEAMHIATGICDALDRAHRSGIVHRDLKPANVMLTQSGAKLLDFGLAKSAAPVVAASGLSMLPTTPPNLTAQGTILGTFQYMAPEQIEGLEADARTDIFAFGALLFEMLTGRTAFEGKTRASLLGAILKDEPPRVSTVQPLAPHAIDRIVSTCLAKDPDDRYQTTRDLLRDLRWVASGSSEDAAPRTVLAPRRSNRLAWLVAAAAGLALAAAAAVAFRTVGGTVPAAGAVQFTIAAPQNSTFGGPFSPATGIATQVSVSPDGRYVVFVAGSSENAFRIWLRPVGTLVAAPIAGTEQGAFPFWSPDSRFIAFFASGKLKKVAVTGGPPTVLCDLNTRGIALGGTWSPDNVIVFSSGTVGAGLLRVSSAGGIPTGVTRLDPATGESNHRWPYFLPDGRHFIYTASTGICCPAAKPAKIRVASLDSAEPAVTLFEVESAVTYASGHLLFVRDDTLMAQPFDLRTRQPSGDVFPLAEHISTEGSRYGSFSASNNGVLAYGRALPADQRLTWVDRMGRTLSPVSDASQNTGLGPISFTLSRDERQVAITLASGSPPNRDVFIIDAIRGVRTRLTTDPGTDTSPVWAPDGTRIAFEAVRAGMVSLRQKRVSGTGDEEVLLEGSTAAFSTAAPSSWSSDGRFIAYTKGAGSLADVWILPLSGERHPFPLAQTTFTETSGMFSPDGRWIVYTSDEGGQRDVYAQPFPPTGARYPVSKDGGSHPVWRADSKELFFIRGYDAMLMAVPIPATPQWDPGPPRPLFVSGARRASPGQQYAVTKDGNRFLMNLRTQDAVVEPLTVIVNWTATIQK
jgi:eukaryotic-like serine/threonine-protein kinase